MKRIIVLLVACIIAFSSVMPVYAAKGNVTYSGSSGDFIFAPGSDNSPTDLFPDLKGVMPGDNLTQKITVRNDADKSVKVKIYMRSLGAHEGSQEFLSQLGLSVQKSEENEMAYMFNAAANETAQLTNWVYLGTLYSGGEVNLDVILDVPTELNNDFKNKIGYLDWEFMIEELPVEKEDPDAPQTGDDFNIYLWIALLILSATVIVFLILRKKREEKAQ